MKARKRILKTQKEQVATGSTARPRVERKSLFLVPRGPDVAEAGKVAAASFRMI